MPALLKTLTLGCRVNQYETEFVRQALLGIGYADAPQEEAADLCIVNTCTVTHEGDAKSRQAIRRLARENPNARLVVMGCYATRAPEEVAALPNVAEVITDKRELPDLLGRQGVRDIPTGLAGFRGRRRAYVKVQDGCMLSCTFCIIPTVRPNLISRPIEHIVDEVQRLTDAGHREIVLTGIHLGHYGVEQNKGKAKADWVRLSHLLRKLSQIPVEFRVRLSSIEATEVTRELIEVMADHADRVCPHLHVSMQSGSDSVLRRMRRRWGRQRFIDRCQLVKDRLDRPALTTDIIVGFPGETDAEFEETCDTAREVGFSKIHIFPFSPRKTTPAATMPDQVSAQLKAERCARLEALEAELQQRYYRTLLGRRLSVLLESPSPDRPGYLLGTSCRYAPVEISSEFAAIGTMAEVTARDVRGGSILAVVS